MMPTCCDATNAHFGAPHAKRDVARYRKKGPDPTTAAMLRWIRSYADRGSTLLDIGAGIGVLHHELLGDICSSAVHVDMSAEYMASARRESTRRGHMGLVRFVFADFASESEAVPDSDVVTLDRVVCCYPEFRPLLERSVRQCQKLLVLSYPRDNWYVRLAFRLDNLKRKLNRDPFRAYVHPVHAMSDIPTEMGFRLLERSKMPFWQVDVYARETETNV